MEKEFVPYKLALELKALGFDEPCLAYYHNHVEYSFVKDLDRGNFIKNSQQNLYHADCTTPTFSQVFRWFREKYGLTHEITQAGIKEGYHAFVHDYMYGNNGNSPSVFSYEEAELACLEKLIEIVKSI